MMADKRALLLTLFMVVSSVSSFHLKPLALQKGLARPSNPINKRVARPSPSVAPAPFFPSGLGPLLASQGEPTNDDDVGFPGLLAIAGGLVACPVCFWSEWTLKTTGCGLPAGPGGALGALEGVSYLIIVAIAAWSLVTKVQTGRGLPNGPAGLLGAVEGMSYLAIVAGLVVAGLTFKDFGSIPEAVPTEGGRCSNI